MGQLELENTLMSTAEAPTATERAGALAERVFNATIETMDLATIYLGNRLGYYQALVEIREATPTELAAHTGTNERYTREWLEQQAVTGILDVADTGDPLTRRYSLPAGHDVALTDSDSLTYITPLAKQFLGMTSVFPALIEAYRTGDGVPYEQYGADVREGIAEANRVLFINLLADEWLPALPDIHQRLQDTTRPAKVADIGCGSGWSTLAIAQAYPAVQIDGLDLDEASIESAKANAAELSLDDRVSFQVRDAGDPSLAGHYDFACAFECIHDMSNPVATLKAMRDLVGSGGTVLIGDERVADTFTAPGDIVERLMYGASVLHCLPVGMAETPSVATGTVMRADILRSYASQAGFRSVEILPIRNDVWQFYRLTA
jgi:SAM-dependent methyltransferase